LDMNRLGDSFVVYVGTHGDAGAHRADVILPSATYTEKQAIYVNTEGRAQMTEQAAFPPGEAREDWKIFRAFSEVLGEKLPYDNVETLRALMFEVAPHLAGLDELTDAGAPDVSALTINASLSDAPFMNNAQDFYFTNPIARASKIMAECSIQAQARNVSEGTGTDG
jgi:NADH-quinone oxidoreductase subunit G